MKTNNKVTTQAKKKKNGFTLIEVIAVLVLLGILAAVAVPKYVDMSAAAKDRAVDAGIAELNSRESLEWGNVSLSDDGYVAASEAAIIGLVGTDIGDSYEITKTATSGTIIFQGGDVVNLTRSVSSASNPASWARATPTQ